MKLEFNAFRNDVCVNASQDDDFQSIIDDVSYIVERVEMMANGLNTILNNLEELQEEEEYLDEEDAENVTDIQSAVKRVEISEKIANIAMEAVMENYRSISEICSIMESVKEGMKEEIAYADPSEMDIDNPYLYHGHY